MFLCLVTPASSSGLASDGLCFFSFASVLLHALFPTHRAPFANCLPGPHLSSDLYEVFCGFLLYASIMPWIYHSKNVVTLLFFTPGLFLLLDSEFPEDRSCVTHLRVFGAEQSTMRMGLEYNRGCCILSHIPM